MLYIIIPLFILLFISVVWYFLFKKDDPDDIVDDPDDIVDDPDDIVDDLYNIVLNNNPEYGIINGWYSNRTSQYLNDEPNINYFNQMNYNIVSSNGNWKLLHLPTAAEFPYYGDWWDWPTELQNINRVIDYLGNTLGRFETHFISMAGTASSSGTQRVNNEAIAIISRDWKIGYNDPGTTPRTNIRVESCAGNCLVYLTKDNRKRIYMAISLGSGATYMLTSSNFINKSNDYKRNWLRNDIYASISHEYTHVFQTQIIEPRTPFLKPLWFAEQSYLGERSPNTITRWWLEIFATALPYFMGLQQQLNLIDEITTGINQFKNSSMTETEFLNRMLYTVPYGYASAPSMSYLTAAYMAKLTSWKNILVDWYYDFQRVPENNIVPGPNNQGTFLVPNLDNVFLHHFGNTEEDFLKDVFTKVRNNVITLNYLSNVLPGGVNFGIPNLVPFTI
jgi:hypothetical protein